MDTVHKHNGHIFRFGSKAQKIKTEEWEDTDVDIHKCHPYAIVLTDDVDVYIGTICEALSKSAPSDYIFVIDLNAEADTDRWKGIIRNHIVMPDETSAHALMRFINNHVLKDNINHFDYHDFVEYVWQYPFVSVWQPSWAAAHYIEKRPQAVFISISCNTAEGIDNTEFVNAASEHAKYLLDKDINVLCAIQKAQAASLEFICLYTHKPAS